MTNYQYICVLLMNFMFYICKLYAFTCLVVLLIGSPATIFCIASCNMLRVEMHFYNFIADDI